MKSFKSNNWEIIGQTETIKDNLNPNFKKTFIVDYIFEVKQECQFEIKDDDGNGKFDQIGECQATLGAIVGAKNNILILDIMHKKTKKKTGNLIIMSEAIEESRDELQMQWQGQKLKNKRGYFGGKQEPFFNFQKNKRRQNGKLLL
ncbi:hypothetical protein IMG5_063670 [Ichthyophthirius multifiliis]|uniref:C2 domain-containing protein n=1 Tax=Ichthyophthirius multifiliis TaxID=5932 RepID=G0QP39_ICHMU|nr:hypothetical protein IMG5_063670 [Ichthyophthirius multifiliis]EGR33026.1 hypothetical protein IMG5_063670 [Ichthyophthirius multifiliis]|eukprot:XP_004037012.1 hypothetical protein IMG5_063670 [Ichthyophthirius multifiliis]